MDNVTGVIKYGQVDYLSNLLGVSSEVFSENSENGLVSEIIFENKLDSLLKQNFISGSELSVCYTYDDARILLLDYCEAKGLDTAVYQDRVKEFLDKDYRYVFINPFNFVRYYRKCVLNDFIMIERIIERDVDLHFNGVYYSIDLLVKETGLLPVVIYSLAKHLNLAVTLYKDKHCVNSVGYHTLVQFLSEHVHITDKTLIKRIKSTKLPVVMVKFGPIFVSKSVYSYLTDDIDVGSWEDCLFEKDGVKYLGEGGIISYLYANNISRSSYDALNSSGITLINEVNGIRSVELSKLNDIVSLCDKGYSFLVSALISMGYFSKYVIDTQMFSQDEYNAVIHEFASRGLISKKIIRYLKDNEFVAFNFGKLKLYSRERLLDALLAYNRGLSVKDINFRNFVSLNSLLSVLDSEWVSLTDINYLFDFGLSLDKSVEGGKWSFTYTGDYFRYLTSTVVVLDSRYLKDDLKELVNEYYKAKDLEIRNTFHEVSSKLLRKGE